LHTYGYLLIIATIITVFAALTTIGVSAVEFNTSPYTYNGESGVTITGFNGLNGGETVTIPAEIDGKPVLAIGLDGVVTTTSVPGAKKIGALDLTQADNLKVILPYAFYNCENLKGTIESNTVEEIGKYAFSSCSNEKYPRISEINLTACYMIGWGAFVYCHALEKVILSDNIYSISHGCFEFCSQLKTVTTKSANTKTGVYLPNVTTIENYAFCGCTNLGNDITLSKCETIGYRAFGGVCSKIERVSAPMCIKIDNGAFSSCEKLTDANFEKCTEVGDYVFSSCSALKNISLAGSCCPPDTAFFEVPNTCYVNGYPLETYIEEYCYAEEHSINY